MEVNNFEGSLFTADVNSLLHDFRYGQPIGEYAQVPALKNTFSWMRGFQQVFSGWPGHGKTEFLMFASLLMAIKKGWKICVWPHEMFSLKRDNGKNTINANMIYTNLAFSLIGKSPYKHHRNQQGRECATEKEFTEAISLIKDLFYVIRPKDRRYKIFADNVKYYHDKLKFDMTIFDPYKNLTHEQKSGQTVNQYMNEVFGYYKDLAMDENIIVNWIAHARSPKDNPLKQEVARMPFPTEHDLSGGATWFDDMDGVFIINRYLKHFDANSPEVEIHSRKLKQQNLVGHLGCVDGIFDKSTNRYYFNQGGDMICPLDGQIYQNNLVANDRPESFF